MSNSSEYYDHTSYPATGTAGSSAAMRAELDTIEAAFNKLPTMTGNGGKLVKVAASADNLEVSTVISDDGTNATIAGDLIISGTQIGQNGTQKHVIPAVASDTLALLAATQTLTNKTIVAASNTITTASSGNLAATELNAALAELQSDIDARATDLANHLNDTTDAHDASAISVSPSGNLSSTDTQGALVELQGDIDAHLADAVDAHDASAISNVPSGGISATTVQAAIDELDAEKADLAGDTFTGDVTVPSLNSGQLAGLRNKIINGKMEIAQRGTSFAAIASGAYSIDRWTFVSASTGAVITASQQADVPNSNEFQSSLRLAVTTADASIAAGEYVRLDQRIEGYNARDLIGRDFTFSFWVRSSKTGVHCVSLTNSISDRSYVAEYTINVANTWEFKTVTVTGGLITAGTWDWTTGIGLGVRFALAAGSTYQTMANAWQAGNFLATANQVNCLDTIGNIFAITGVQLEVGSVATPFEHRPYGAELALCQRYYQRMIGVTGNKSGMGLCVSSTVFNSIISFPVPMRIAPTALEQSGTAADYSISNSGGTVTCSAVPAFNSASNFVAESLFTVATGLTAGQAAISRFSNANSYLGWSSEL